MSQAVLSTLGTSSTIASFGMVALSESVRADSESATTDAGYYPYFTIDFTDNPIVDSVIAWNNANTAAPYNGRLRFISGADGDPAANTNSADQVCTIQPTLSETLDRLVARMAIITASGSWGNTVSVTRIPNTNTIKISQNQSGTGAHYIGWTSMYANFNTPTSVPNFSLGEVDTTPVAILADGGRIYRGGYVDGVDPVEPITKAISAFGVVGLQTGTGSASSRGSLKIEIFDKNGDLAYTHHKTIGPSGSQNYSLLVAADKPGAELAPGEPALGYWDSPQGPMYKVSSDLFSSGLVVTSVSGKIVSGAFSSGSTANHVQIAGNGHLDIAVPFTVVEA